jgi:hypothetical protein
MKAVGEAHEKRSKERGHGTHEDENPRRTGERRGPERDLSRWRWGGGRSYWIHVWTQS